MPEVNAYKPKIVAFCCNWCSYAGADLAGTNRLNYPADVKIIRVPCSCPRQPPLCAARLPARGRRGHPGGLPPGDCHYSTGNYYARRRMTLLFSMLDYLGVERERTRVEWISARRGREILRHHERVLPERRRSGREQKAEGSAMQGVAEKILERYRALLQEGAVDRLLGWKKGEFFYDPTPAVFMGEEGLSDFVYGEFCGSNLSKYLIDESKRRAGCWSASSPATPTASTSSCWSTASRGTRSLFWACPAAACWTWASSGRRYHRALDAHVEGTPSGSPPSRAGRSPARRGTPCCSSA